MASIKAEKTWADAVRKAVHEYHEETDENGRARKTKYINLLARTLVGLAANKGDMQAMKEIGDRLDGKPGQAIEHSGHVKVTKITEEFVMPDGERYSSEDTDAVRIPTAH